MTYYIVSRYHPTRQREIVDQTDSRADANYLQDEYRLAFGRNFTISVLTNPPRELLEQWENR